MVPTGALRSRIPSLVLSVSLVIGMSAGTARASIPGFTEDFTAGLGGFLSGASLTHVPSGGVGGAGDGYISVTRTKPDHLGAAAAASEFTGNLTADGVTGVSFWLNDIGDDQPLEIHVGVGNSFGNFWQSTASFSPPENGWGLFSIDFDDPADWVQIRGAGTFPQALTVTDRILFRHDQAPYEWFPDAITGEMGIDRVTLLPEPGTIALLTLGALAGLRGRRRS